MTQGEGTLESRPQEVSSREDLVEFIFALREDLRKHPEAWENNDLGWYLESLGGWLMDADGYYRSAKQKVSADVPSWRLFADSLIAARVYE